MRKFAIGCLLVAGFLTWVVTVVFLWFTTLLAVLGKKLERPGDDLIGNCWTYALPRYHEHGGWLLIRSAYGVRFLKYFKISHVAWVKELPPEGLIMEQFDPISRDHSKWLPWKTIWYHGRVLNYELKRKPRE